MEVKSPFLSVFLGYRTLYLLDLFGFGPKFGLFIMQNYPVTREWNEADWLEPLLIIKNTIYYIEITHTECRAWQEKHTKKVILRRTRFIWFFDLFNWLNHSFYFIFSGGMGGHADTSYVKVLSFCLLLSLYPMVWIRQHSASTVFWRY